MRKDGDSEEAKRMDEECTRESLTVGGWDRCTAGGRDGVFVYSDWCTRIMACRGYETAVRRRNVIGNRETESKMGLLYFVRRSSIQASKLRAAHLPTR